MRLPLSLSLFSVLLLLFLDRHLRRDKVPPYEAISEMLSDPYFYAWVASLAWTLYELSQVVRAASG